MEPIAITGIGCRFPGANGPADFWRLLRNKVDAVRLIPADRWDIDAYFDADIRTPGKMNTRWAGLLDNVDHFDRKFFSIRPREATRMDLQQRILLEVCYECLEDGGQVLEEIDGARIGVFLGVSPGDCGRLQMARLQEITPFTATGSLVSIAANRVSYVFNFRGPSLAVDTACSSSLVSVHLACQSLRAGECQAALAGGVNIIFTPDVTVAFSKAGAMSPDGRCKAFDASANGYVRSEGAGVVLLRPLAKAIADGDQIYALILGSAVNQDGRTNGLTAPNRWAQEEVLRDAYKNAGVSPGAVQYVETHGTGTLLGDPIEAKALGAVLSEGRPPDSPCRIGSVKTNIGHLETAAGVASLIKVALNLRHKQIPPNLHFTAPNPRIPFEELGLCVQTDLIPWPKAEGPRLTGVSSFGFGGTNAHVVLQEAISASDEAPRRASAYLLPLSARGLESLLGYAAAYRRLAESLSSDNFHDICFSASVRRSHFEHRAAVLFKSREELVSQLEKILDGQHLPKIRGELSPVLVEAANAYTAGQTVNWKGLYPEGGRCVSLPSYPWNHVRSSPEEEIGSTG